MTAPAAERHVSHFADLYSQLYGLKAQDEALRYALVVRSVGDLQEHDFWLQVADALDGVSPAARHHA